MTTTTDQPTPVQARSEEQKRPPAWFLRIASPILRFEDFLRRCVGYDRAEISLATRPNGCEIFYPVVAKKYKAWTINVADNPIIMANPGFETYLAGWQAAESTQQETLVKVREALTWLCVKEVHYDVDVRQAPNLTQHAWEKADEALRLLTELMGRD